MPDFDRRQFVQSSVACTSGLWLANSARGEEVSMERPSLRIAPFRFDVTPPLGHSLCGGWIKPVEAIDDPLEAIGFVLLGSDQPIVVCSVDWTGLLNEAHSQWCKALAEAAGTSPDRVAVQCVHQHDAPFVCLEAQRIVSAQGDLPSMIDLDFFQRCLDAGRNAVEQALKSPVELTQIASSQAAVDRVACNRRLEGLDGLVKSMRGSGSRDPVHQRFPEGLIDPFLKTIAFYNGNTKVAACHYYACHPMSHYGKGRVSSDFCGLARKRRQKDQPLCTHLYFNGCGGNIGAGKYNDASDAMRPILAQRMYEAIVASETNLQPQPIQSVRWATEAIMPVTRPEFQADKIEQQIGDATRSVVDRSRPAYILSWMRRCQAGIPITLSGLHINDISLLHLPSECFVEYQLRAQVAAPNRFVACAAYGDGGPWYIPTRDAYAQGGYEVSVAWCEPNIDRILSQGMQALLQVGP